jgi:hypothetical protein
MDCIKEPFNELPPQGNVKSPIWLIGDSDPKKSAPKLKCVFDPRHPTIHNIWTPILYRLQKQYVKEAKEMFPVDQIYIDNAIHNPYNKPGGNDLSWEESDTYDKEKADYLKDRMNVLKTMINENSPKMIITFGAFAFEFIRRCEVEEPFHESDYWDTKKLRIQFMEFIDNNNKIIVPLLHRSISMGHFISSHNFFSDEHEEIKINGNYFEFVSKQLYPKFKEIYESPETQRLLQRLNSPNS